MITKKSRKQLRKEQRKQKKARKNDYYTHKSSEKHSKSPDEQVQPFKNKLKSVKNLSKNAPSAPIAEKKIQSLSDSVTTSIKKEKTIQKKLEKQMKKQRKETLFKANLEEDRVIKQLEKQLKLNKRKSKNIPKTFVNDGLDYLLEVCDSENLKGIAAAEQQFAETDMDFEEDFALMNEKKSQKQQSFGSDEEHSDEEPEDGFFVRNRTISKNKKHKTENKSINEEFNSKEDEEHEINDEDIEEEEENNDTDSQMFDEETNELSESEEENTDNDQKDETWEDIYGRLRGKDGSIIQNNERKYIPPAIKAKLEAEATGGKNEEKSKRLRRQLKGLINRLAEANMHKIAVEIEQLFMSNSRNDMNETLTSLIFEALISPLLTPERFVIEHMMLVAILHANVGTEVGAHFLQCLVKKFDEIYNIDQPNEDKTLENIVQTLSHLYNFKVFDSSLLYQVLEKLNSKFNERNIECILLTLKSVGFSLRKDDPINLKNLILNIQKQATNNASKSADDPRVKFMLDILMAIKNNNMTKIPNYDPSYAEHLKKLLKNFVRKGLYVSSLNISLEDLLKAEERGKWWIVGSAWVGKETNDSDSNKEKVQKNYFSQKLLELARKQRMNTDTRRNIFCILMSAEDYLDAFEKLSHLGLKNQQEREIIHVILHCCLQEKTFNPYYAFLAQKFCDSNRRFQLTIKYSVWDKLKALSDCSGAQLSNLAKLLTHLFLEKGLPVSTLKIMQFSELDKITLRFMRQILLGLLLHQDVEQCLQVFEKVSHGDKLKMFRESLRLFIKHFLLRNLKANTISEEQRVLLEERANLVDKALSLGDKKVKF